MKFETKIVTPNVLLEVKDMAADPSSDVFSFVVDTIFCMHFLDTECMVNTPD